jgi:hypothetical protein
MKGLLSLFLLLLFSLLIHHSAYAQNVSPQPDTLRFFQPGFRIIGGGSFHNASGFKNKSPFGATLAVGVFANWNLNNRWSILSELRIGQRNSTISYPGLDAGIRELLFVEIPICVIYSFTGKKGKELLSISAGGLYGITSMRYKVNNLENGFYFTNINAVPRNYISSVVSVSKKFRITRSKLFFLGLEYDQQLILNDKVRIELDHYDRQLSTYSTIKNNITFYNSGIFFLSGIIF